MTQVTCYNNPFFIQNQDILKWGCKNHRYCETIMVEPNQFLTSKCYHNDKHYVYETFLNVKLFKTLQITSCEIRSTPYRTTPDEKLRVKGTMLQQYSAGIRIRRSWVRILSEVRSVMNVSCKKLYHIRFYIMILKLKQLRV